MFIIQVKTASGWRKARSVGVFLLEESAYAYGAKYLMQGWYRVVNLDMNEEIEGN